MSDPLLDLDYKPHLPERTDFGVAMVGCGGIVNYATLPTYRKYGLNLRGCFDVNPQAAEKTALAFNLPVVYRSLDEILNDRSVDIVEISVPPWHQLAIVRQVAAAGKHMLCQKPLSTDFAEAREIVRLAREAGVKLAVNQQMRWDQGIRASRTLMCNGWLGEVTDGSIQVSVNTPWHMWGWLAEQERLEVYFHSIHYIDSMRYLFGDPIWVTSRHSRYPLQGSLKGETKTVTIMDYDTPSHLQVLIADNHYNLSDDYFAIFRFIGTEGFISGTIGTMYNYPTGRPDTLEWSSRRHYPDKRFEAKLEGMWIPDAFIGPITSLMDAIQTDGVPETDGADNLNTLRVVEATYLSARENRSVQLHEIN
jgi:predicted dehydrogenase